MNETTPFDRIAFHGSVGQYLSRSLKSKAATLQSEIRDDTGQSLVVACAEEILGSAPWDLPQWVDTQTQYLVILDVPVQVVPRIATVLRLHKPDQRLHITQDHEAVKRTVIALSRLAPWEGIVDAYVISELLCVLLGDMTERAFPKKQVPGLKTLRQEGFESFTIDSAGSFLYWHDVDLHMGASQLLQAVDPAYLADIEIERYGIESLSQALYEMRVDRGLRQTDIQGVSERHVRRLENEKVRLNVDTAETFARAFGQDLTEFLDELSERITAQRVGQEFTV